MGLKKIVNHSLFKSSLIYTVSNAINKAVPFLILPVLSYYLAPSDYGVVANFNVFLAVCLIFVMVGIDGAISVSYYKFDKNELAKYVFNGILILISASVLLALITWLSSDIVYSYLKIPLRHQLWTVASAFFAGITSINLALWRLGEKPVNFGVYQISQTLVNIGISLILVISYNMGWVGRISGIITAIIAFGLYSLFLLFKRGYLNVDFNKKMILGLLSFGLPLIPHTLSFWMRSGVDRILITKMINETATGLYATGFQFGILISFITISYNNAFVPYVYKLLSVDDGDDLNRNKRNLVKLVYSGIIGLVLISFIFIALSQFVLKNFFDDAYEQASVFIPWAIIAQTFQGMYLFFVNYIFFVKKTRFLALITFGCALLQIVLSYFSIRYFGSIGAAYSTVLVSFINFILVAVYSNSVYNMPWFKFNR